MNVSGGKNYNTIKNEQNSFSFKSISNFGNIFQSSIGFLFYSEWWIDHMTYIMGK